MQQSKQQAMIWYSEYQKYRVIIHEQGGHSPAAGEPRRCAHQERLGGRHAKTTKTKNFVLYIVFFFCFAICVIDNCLAEDT